MPRNPGGNKSFFGGGSVPQKPHDTKKTLKRLWVYLAQHKWLVLISLILTIGSNLLALVGPMLSGWAIDSIGTKAGAVNFEKVFYYCGLMGIFFLISSVLSYILSLIMINLSQKVAYQMRKDVFDHLTELPVSFFDHNQAGDIVSHLSYDIDTVNASLSNDLIQVATSLITVIGSFAMMLAISPPLVLVFLVTIPISIVATKYLTGKVRPLFRARSAKLGELNGYVEEIITGHKTIKSYHRESVFAGRFAAYNKAASDANYDANYYGSMVGPCINFINNLSLALISVFGALLYLFGNLTLGNLSSFVLYSRKFSGPINEIANIMSELQSACSAAERVFRLIDEEPELADVSDAAVLSKVHGDVGMNHIRFGYDPERIIIDDLNLSAEAGSLVAIVGPTGAGKTTLINLLMRFYDPQSGTLTIDGGDISKMTRKSLRLAYAMVLQDTWLFHGTVFENIAYGRPDATMDEVVAAAKIARIHGYIEALPEGYDTILNEDGINISQGQKQLITIARAMLLDAPMLILDEATSNVDTRTEIQIQKAMTQLMGRQSGGEEKTCFIIAHRLSTIQEADIILVVRDGAIVEKGNHQELLRQEGVYAGLFQSQFR